MFTELKTAAEAVLNTTYVEVTNGQYTGTIGILEVVETNMAYLDKTTAGKYILYGPLAVDTITVIIKVTTDTKSVNISIRPDWVKILPGHHTQVYDNSTKSAKIYDRFGVNINLFDTVFFSYNGAILFGQVQSIDIYGKVTIRTKNPHIKKSLIDITIDKNCYVINKDLMANILMDKLQS